MAGASETIVKLRTEKGWSQQELADRLLVSRSLVSMWELGSRKPDRFSVERMADLFGVSAEDKFNLLKAKRLKRLFYSKRIRLCLICQRILNTTF